MKSLLTVLALTIALGAGYWKLQNPEGGVIDARADASAAWQRAQLSMANFGGKSELRRSFETKLNEKLFDQASETETKLSAIAQANEESADKLEQRLQSLEEKFSLVDNTSQQQLDSISDTTSRLERAMEASQAITDEQLDAFKNSIEENKTEQNEQLQERLSAYQSAIQRQLDNLKAGDQNASIALDTFTEKLESLDTRLDTLTSANVTPRSGNDENDELIETGLAAVTAQVDQRLAAMENRLAAATSADTRTLLDSLSMKLDDTTSSLDTLEAVLQQNVSKNSRQFGEVQRELAKLKADFQSLTSTVESSSIENSQNDLRQQLTELEEIVKSSPNSSVADMSNITQALEQSGERLRTLEQRLTDMPASSKSDDVIALQDELQAKIVELEEKLVDVKATPDEKLVSTLSAVQQKVSELENKNFLTADDVEKLNETKSIQYKIYFDIGSTEISEDAGKVLDSMIAQESNRAINVSIFGTTDRSGSVDFNQQLALKRANRVRSYLIQNGFDFTKIRDVDGIGEDLAAAVLPDGQTDANQRSVIIFAFQP